jgi:hypothetical protein
MPPSWPGLLSKLRSNDILNCPLMANLIGNIDAVLLPDLSLPQCPPHLAWLPSPWRGVGGEGRFF